MTPKRVIATSDSSSVSVRPSRVKSRSSRKRRVGSASALKTRSSSSFMTPGYVTIRSHVNAEKLRPAYGPGGVGLRSAAADQAAQLDDPYRGDGHGDEGAAHPGDEHRQRQRNPAVEPEEAQRHVGGVLGHKDDL